MPIWQLGHVGKGADVFAEPPQSLSCTAGILMILAWVLSATVGQLVARYCRGAVLSRKVCGAAAWFRVSDNVQEFVE